MTDHYDIIVIGSGAGGGTLTYALAPTGKCILLLERGDFLPREPQNWDSKSVWVDLRCRNPGKWTDADTGAEFTQCREDVLPGYSYLGGRLDISAAAHQNGTVRFGADPATSALDPNCKMYELDNLYVLDSSFFVSSTAVNPTLTIIANALRLADHIVGRLGSGKQREAQPAFSPEPAATPVPGPAGVTAHA